MDTATLGRPLQPLEPQPLLLATPLSVQEHYTEGSWGVAERETILIGRHVQQGSIEETMVVVGGGMQP